MFDPDLVPAQSPQIAMLHAETIAQMVYVEQVKREAGLVPMDEWHVERVGETYRWMRHWITAH